MIDAHQHHSTADEKGDTPSVYYYHYYFCCFPGRFAIILAPVVENSAKQPLFIIKMNYVS